MRADSAINDVLRKSSLTVAVESPLHGPAMLALGRFLLRIEQDRDRGNGFTERRRIDFDLRQLGFNNF
jgi:hypothetical protein